MQQITIERMWEMLWYKGRDEAYIEGIPELADIDLELKTSRYITEQTRYCRYLNLLSDFVREQRRLPDTVGIIRFDDCSKTQVTGHPMGTKAAPAFVAVRKAMDKPLPSPLYWSALEAIGEVDPGDDELNAEARNVASLGRLLQARPDHISVQGISTQPEGFKLVVANACGDFATELLEWDEEPSRRILCAWISCLYKPTNVDASITVNNVDTVPTFNIQCPGVTYPGCSIRCVGDAFSRRTTIFDTADPNVIIKEQYVEAGRQNEGSTLDTIHHGGVFPGVVRVGWHGTIKPEDGQRICVRDDDGVKEKRRLVMLDQAGSLMDATSLRDALIALYDLLEVTRFLNRKRGVLHRDISASNVLLRDVAMKVDHPFAEDLQDMCFATHLLKQKSHASNVERLDTRVLLIDFDTSEDRTGAQGGTGDTSRVGTSIFMARVVRAGEYDRGIWELPSIPQMSDGLEAYKASVGDRLEAFPPNDVELVKISSPELGSLFQHRLRHDAESVFWLLLWWTMLACPENDTSQDRILPNDVWRLFTDAGGMGRVDTRSLFLVRQHKETFHPAYKPVEELVDAMSSQLLGDHDASNDPFKQKDEYLHEGFQRLILEFLFKNYDAEFMISRKSPQARQVGKAPRKDLNLLRMRWSWLASESE